MKEIVLNTVVKVCSCEELEPVDRMLVNAAREAAKGSYAPYSRFNVGAALLLANGEVVVGSNQENAAYPSGLCAERVALFSAGAQYPARAVDTLVIAARNADGELSRPIAPCGACRQVMLEVESRHKRAMRVILFGTDCCYIIEGGAKELLPLSFDSGFLEG
jgi:cytidine deaminase